MTTQVLSKVRLGQDFEDGGPFVMNYTMQYCLSQAGQSSGSGPKDWRASGKPCCIIYFMTLSDIHDYQLLITHSHAFAHGDHSTIRKYHSSGVHGHAHHMCAAIAVVVCLPESPTVTDYSVSNTTIIVKRAY